MHIPGHLALEAIGFSVQEVAQPLQFRHQLLDFQHRRTCYPLNKRIDSPDLPIVAFDHRHLQASGHRQASGPKWLRTRPWLSTSTSAVSAELSSTGRLALMTVMPMSPFACASGTILSRCADHPGECVDLTAAMGRGWGSPFSRSVGISGINRKQVRPQTAARTAKI